MGAKQVYAKNLTLDFSLRNKGMELGAWDGDTFLGDLIATKTGLIWCKGKTSRANGVKVTRAEFAEWMES